VSNLCGVCRRETDSKWGFCYRPGPCNAARQRAIKQAHRRLVTDLQVEILELEVAALRQITGVSL
jgi:hypothetical protein